MEHVEIINGKFKGLKGRFICENENGTYSIHIFAFGEYDFHKDDFVFV